VKYGPPSQWKRWTVAAAKTIAATQTMTRRPIRFFGAAERIIRATLMPDLGTSAASRAG
jgi:hypothetical protein